MSFICIRICVPYETAILCVRSSHMKVIRQHNERMSIFSFFRSLLRVLVEFASNWCYYLNIARIDWRWIAGCAAMCHSMPWNSYSYTKMQRCYGNLDRKKIHLEIFSYESTPWARDISSPIEYLSENSDRMTGYWHFLSSFLSLSLQYQDYIMIIISIIEHASMPHKFV